MPNNPKPILLKQDGTPVYPVTDASLVMNLAVAAGIFWAEYGVTTATEIATAVAAGKIVMCNHSQHIYRLEDIRDGQPFYFSAWMASQARVYLTVNQTTSAWSESSLTMEYTGNRASSITGNETNTTKYPSTKAVYDAINPAVVTTQPAGGFLPNVVYDLGELTGTITFALATPTDANIANAYYWTFETGTTAPTITWPSNIIWIDGSAPTISASKHYEIMIRNGYGTYLEI